MQAPNQNDPVDATNLLPTKRPLWPKLLTVVVLLGIAAVAVTLLPRGYSQDITLIGQGGNVVVLYHDSYAVNSQENMIAMNDLRDEYDGRVKFIVADKNVQEGEQFSQKYGINSVALVFFSPAGEKIKVIFDPQNVQSLRHNLDTEFHL